MRSILFVISILLISFTINAQPAFEDEIKAFKKQDSIKFPPKNAILFVGSSSFRLWKTIEEDFPKHIIINRGFGGSTLEDVIRYSDDIIIPYNTKQIVIYCGENDIASGQSSQAVLDRFDKLFTSIRRKQPKVAVAFVSMKPSPSRFHLIEEIKKGNQLIRDYLTDYKNTTYIDVYSLMLGPEGRPKQELFVDDNLHLNQNGYALWKKAILPRLK